MGCARPGLEMAGFFAPEIYTDLYKNGRDETCGLVDIHDCLDNKAQIGGKLSFTGPVDVVRNSVECIELTTNYRIILEKSSILVLFLSDESDTYLMRYCFLMLQ